MAAESKGDCTLISCRTVLSYCRQNDTVCRTVMDYPQCLTNRMLILILEGLM